MVLDDVEASLEALCGIDPSALCDGETVERLHRCLARLEAATTRAVASFDARREWDADGARSAAAWLTRKCRLPRQAARRRVRVGRALRHLPAAERAWLAGEVGEAQVAAWCGCARRPPKRLWRTTRRCWWARRRACATTTSPGCWPTGANTSTPTVPRTPPRPSAIPGGCTCRRASATCGSSTGCSTLSAG